MDPTLASQDAQNGGTSSSRSGSSSSSSSGAKQGHPSKGGHQGSLGGSGPKKQGLGGHGGLGGGLHKPGAGSVMGGGVSQSQGGWIFNGPPAVGAPIFNPAGVRPMPSPHDQLTPAKGVNNRNCTCFCREPLVVSGAVVIYVYVVSVSLYSISLPCAFCVVLSILVHFVFLGT